MNRRVINLAIKGYKSKKIENLEKRIENLENAINKKADSAAAKKNCSFSLDSFNKQNSLMLDPEEEDDQF